MTHSAMCVTWSKKSRPEWYIYAPMNRVIFGCGKADLFSTAPSGTCHRKSCWNSWSPANMMSSNIFRVTGHLCGVSQVTGEFPAQRPVTRSFDIFFDLRLNKRLSKQSWCWWFETPSRSLWRHCNEMTVILLRPCRVHCYFVLTWDGYPQSAYAHTCSKSI